MKHGSGGRHEGCDYSAGWSEQPAGSSADADNTMEAAALGRTWRRRRKKKVLPASVAVFTATVHCASLERRASQRMSDLSAALVSVSYRIHLLYTYEWGLKTEGSFILFTHSWFRLDRGHVGAKQASPGSGGVTKVLQVLVEAEFSIKDFIKWWNICFLVYSDILITSSLIYIRDI